jgi:8-oxo-dGTP pyrophosphatase MutT (NUDIX family)
MTMYEVEDRGAGMTAENATFTAEDFRARAEAHALPLFDEAALAPGIAGVRGEHDSEGGLMMDVAPDSYRLAAVLIAVVDRPGEATVLLTRRASHLSSHGGQIAFPGGKKEAEDATIIDTALREAHEEIGLEPGLVNPIARLDTYHTGSGFRIVPVLGVLSPDFSLAPDPSEVAEIFEVPLQFLMTVANHQRHSMEWQGRQRFFYAMPYGERYIWGATAGILRIMYERLYTA